MSALEKFSAVPNPARHLARALPAVDSRSARAWDPFEGLIRLGERLLPASVFLLDRPNGSDELLTWPRGIMGRRSAIEPLAKYLLERVSSGEEHWIASLEDHPACADLPDAAAAGPLAFACVPLATGAAPARFGAIRARGDWSEDERCVLRDLAAAVRAACGRDRQGRMAEPVASAVPLLNRICHELKNPLTAIKSFAELLLMDVRSAEDREALEIVQREAHRAARILSDVRGTEVTVALPHAAELPPKLETGVDPASEQRLRMLVVDDEAPIRYSLVRYMERRGHEVHEAADGATALEMVTCASAIRYDIVVADLQMPGFGGEALFGKLRDRGEGLEQRLIVMTGDATSPGAARLLQEAGIPVMWKPFELGEVAQMIEAHARLLAG